MNQDRVVSLCLVTGSQSIKDENPKGIEIFN